MKLSARARAYGTTLEAISRTEGLGGKGTKVQRGARFLSFGIRLYDPLQVDRALKLAEPLALATSTSVVIAHREAGLILYQFQLANAFWEDYTRADLVTDRDHVGVGLAEGRRQIDFNFDVPHVGVFGITGSGKTKTVESMLAGLFTAYSPDDLQAVIVDLKGKYTAFTNLAHLQGMPIARNEEEINTVLAFINAELKKREGNSEFNARRIVLVIDEAEAIFQNRTRLQIGTAIVERGREIHINGLFACQQPHKGNFKHMLKQVGGRWCGLVDDAHTSRSITGRAGLECHRLTGKGDFMKIKPGGLHDRLQVALATEADFDRLPRAEMAPPEFEVSEPLDLAQLPEPKEETGPGRPREEIMPEAIGYYVLHMLCKRDVTQRMAREVLGLGKLLHYRHRDWARREVRAINKLLEEWGYG